MKHSKVIKLIIGLLVALFMIMFFVENMDPAVIYFPLLKGKKIGLIYIMMLSYISGAVTAVFVMSRLGARMKKRRDMLKPSDDEQELFDEE